MHYPITTAPLENLPLCSLRSTQGQWWDNDFWLAGTERRVELVAGQMGHHLWTATVRGRKPSTLYRSWFFVTSTKDSEPIAIFTNLVDREVWLHQRWQERQAGSL